jgi:hypothetical protein
MSGRTQLPWFRDLAVGDILQERSGAFRVVRNVSRYKDGDLRCVALAIRRCSWTRRAYTIVFYNDLRHRGFRKVANVRATLTRPLDLKIQAAIHQPAWEPKCATCHDTRGIA